MKRPTIKDVAAHAGVSKATVSLVLRDSDQIPESTKARVRGSMAALGYVYNRRAAEMRGFSSRTLGLVVANIRNPYFAELTQAVEDRAHADRFTLLLGCSNDDVQRQQELLRTMAEQRVDGVVLLPANRTAPADLTATLDEVGMPHVLVARAVPGYQSNYVSADNRAAGRLLGEHLRERGARSVAFVGGVADSVPRQDRIAGLLAGLTPRVDGLSVDIPSERDADFEAPQIVDAVIGAVPGAPDAVVGYNDMYALGIMSALRSRGLEPGRDVMVAGFDNVPEAETRYPGLTTVDGFPARAGVAATELLLDALGGQEPSEPQVVSLEPVLRVRGSTVADQT